MGEERMMEGDVANLFVYNLELSEEGIVDFAIITEGNYDECYGPETQASTKCLGKVVGPVTRSERTSWQLVGQPGDSYRIEFLVLTKGSPSVTWIKEKIGGE